MAMPRLLWQAAWPVCKGIGMALGEIPKEAFQALAHDEEEAEVAYQTYQAYKRLENAQ
jgi:hypothetical protein